MEDGSLAVGLFNLSEVPQEITVTQDELGLSGEHQLRDVWRHQDLGNFQGKYSTRINRHGVAFLRILPTVQSSR
jgi:alpha-galactosidase